MPELHATPALPPGRVVVNDAVSIEVRPPCSYLRLQMSRREPEHAPLEVLGTVLPTQPGSCCGVDPVAWWMAPQSWLIASDRCSGVELAAALESSCRGRACEIVDVSDSFVVLQVRGRSARDLLARGTGVDVRAASFGPGHGTRLEFAQLAVLLRPTAEDTFELLVDRSTAHWLVEWLSAAASALS